MRRGPKPAKSKDGKPPVARKSSKDDARVRDLEGRLEEALKGKEAALGKLQTRDRELTEAQEQQTATAEILRVISSSPTEVQPVFDSIVTSGRTLTGAEACGVFLLHGDIVSIAAHDSLTDEWRQEYPRAVSANTVTGRAMLERTTVHVWDLETNPDYEGAPGRRVGIRTVLAVPMLKEGKTIGAIAVWRTEVKSVNEQQIALLQTFADQAVIAIENVRLFTELLEKNRALTEAHAQVTETLEQQTATSDILKVISQSQTDAQPVFEAIAESALRLCDAKHGLVFLFDGELIHLAAITGTEREGTETARRSFPQAPGRASATTRAIQTLRAVVIHDVREDPEFELTEISRVTDFRSVMSVPMIRAGKPIGAVTVTRAAAAPFPDKQVALLQTFADQAVIAIENVRLFTELQQKNEALTQAHAQVTETLDQQTATSEILGVISRSPTDVQPIFDAITTSAVTLCGGVYGALVRFDGELGHLVAFYNARPGVLDFLSRDLFPVRPGPGTSVGVSLLERRIVHIPDIEAEPGYQRPIARSIGFRSVLTVPLFRELAIIGTLSVFRPEAGPFSDKQIALLKTFADQAVIAIENVRLFTELQARNNDLTATSKILQVIASSPTDLQPVFNVIASSALRLCDGVASLVFRYDGALIHLAASDSAEGIDLQAIRHNFPAPPERATFASRVVTVARPLYIADIEYDPDAPSGLVEFARTNGFRSIFAAPMRRDEHTIGVIAVTHQNVGGFTTEQGALLKTFADQAVIAIENVRLFNELQTTNRDLREALEQQTATSELLKVIGRSTFDLQPVFETLAENSVRLCGAKQASIFQFDGQLLRIAATHNATPETRAFLEQHPIVPGRQSGSARAAFEQRTIHIHDAQSDSEYTYGVVHVHPLRTVLATPMLRAGNLLGVIFIYRDEVRPFSDSEIALLETFADQAAIAIENARLLTELQTRTDELTRSVEQLTALGDVGRAVSSSLDLDTVLSTIVGRAVQLSGTEGGTIFEYDEGAEEFMARATVNPDEGQSALLRAIRLRRGEGAVGQMAVTRQPIQIPDIAAEGAYESRIRGAMLDAGTRSVLAIPLLHEEQLVGGLVVTRRVPGAFTVEVVDLLRTFATQSALAIQNARLFREIEVKSRQLEVASQHKSEFLANMSHELRTPLNAIIGFSEVLSERMFGDLNEKQEEYLKDIYASGTHLLSLINDILDLSKIEAGRMELELSDFRLPTVLDSALTLVRERAGRRNITLHTAIDERLGQIQADERKVRQVVLNLLSNAIKFTPEGGRIEVGAVPNDGFVEVSVSDTGVGIAPEDQEAVFEEFRQVGTAAKKVEGTGLGLTLCRKFVELHGGKIWVKSQLGQGSTFTFTIPVRLGE